MKLRSAAEAASNGPVAENIQGSGTRAGVASWIAERISRLEQPINRPGWGQRDRSFSDLLASLTGSRQMQIESLQITMVSV